MTTITMETRKESYEDVMKNLSVRQIVVLQGLDDMGKSATAGELAMYLYRSGLFATSDRNNVHPRLNELVKMGVVQVVAKRPCQVSGKTCALYLPLDSFNYGKLN